MTRFPVCRTIVIRFLGILAVCIPFGSSLADHSWNNYHWARIQNPFELQLINSTTPDWDPHLQGSILEWNASAVLGMVVSSNDDSTRTRKRCQNISGQIHVCNADYGANGWLGLATIGINSQGHIDRGSVKVNDTYYQYLDTDNRRNHVMCQEIGHVFGLGHTSEDGSSQSTCMDYSWDETSQWPNAHDFEQLVASYSHTDSYNSYAEPPSDGGGTGGDSGGCNSPPGKGCNKNGSIADVPPMGVRVVQNKNFEIWVAARNDGGLWIHHVRLIPEQ